MRFKTGLIEDEYLNNKISSRLEAILFMLDKYVKIEFDKEILITGLIRSQKEQDDIYGNNPAYQKKPWKSVHQYGRGADIRVHNFTQTELDKIGNFLNMITYDENRLHKKTAIVHDVGRGNHIHIQVMG